MTPPEARQEVAMEQERKDAWAAGDLYEPYVGRWSRRVAVEFLEWLPVPEKTDWLDLGCGTGALTQAILARKAPQRVLGVDSSPAYAEYARTHTASPLANFQVADARSLPLDGASVGAAVSGLVLNFVPQPGDAVAEMVRVVRPGGVVAAYVWDYGGKMELMRYFWDAAVSLDSGAKDLDEGRRFPICNPAPLAQVFISAGLGEVEVRAIDVPTEFRDFEDYWAPFLGGQGPAPGYAMSQSEEQRSALRSKIRQTLPVSADGSIHLIARAWAARGRAPGAS